MMDFGFWPHLGIALISIALIAVGFTLRARPWGVGMIWLAVLLLLGLIVHSVLTALNV